ncbi:MAG: OmpA family protein [Saprospiraceae bacterium]
MKKLFLLFAAAVVTLQLEAQPLNRSTPEANLEAAKEAKASGNLYAALEKYEDVYDEDKKNKEVAAEIAMLNYELRDYKMASRGFSRLVLRDRKQEFTELKYWYAMSLKKEGNYADAKDMFRQYLSEGSDEDKKASARLEIEGCDFAREAKQPENLKVSNLGKNVNSPQTEATPFVSGNTFYFTSLQAKEVITVDGKEGDWQSKIYTASSLPPEEDQQEFFSEPTALGMQINREGWHQGNVSISPDGNTMYFTRVQLDANRVTESKIFYALKGPDGWGAAVEVEGVNGEYIAKHPCEGELFGERVLFFVADIPGGEGGFDLYYSPKKKDGLFGLPVNLGNVVNTKGDESSPFYSDGKLFFSSDGLVSMGGFDVYSSQWNGSVWSKPVNLGAGINTSLDDIFYMQLPDGKKGYLVSNRPGPNNLKSKTCCDDMYYWELEEVKVQLLSSTFRYRMRSENLKTNPPLLGCTVQVFDVTDKNPKNVEEKTDQGSNEFSFTLKPERSYMVIATNAKYLPDTVTFNTVGVKRSIQVNKKHTLRVKRKPKPKVITREEPIRLTNIYYDFDDDKILPASEPDLQFLVDLMNKYPDMRIELSSHTDSQGKDSYNEKLSQRRAESAKNWMIAKGIAGDRIEAVGYGESKILNQCTNGVQCTDEEHRFNRRTEFQIIAGPTSITIEEEVEVQDEN